MTTSNALLEVKNLTKRYGDLTAVDDLSLSVLEGEVLGLLGPNGAGKTTTINMIVGLLKPDAGEVYLHGVPLASGETATVTRVGVCPQEIVLWGRLTCLEQMQFIGEMYGMRGVEARQRGEMLLDILELTDKKDKRADTLSGGMKRRLNLGMSMVHDPEVLVLDEPEAGLDPQSRVLVREYIQSLAREKTIILTTHNMDEADRMSDRVAIIDRGKLLVLDTPEALKARVGAGDVVEISLTGPPISEDAVRRALTSLKEKVTMEITESNLTLRALNLVQLLPDIIDRLEAVDLATGEIRLRGNTLEDVFIQLTGRSLRE
jgi:ABC-2 type transport system ATP-binding protein